MATQLTLDLYNVFVNQIFGAGTGFAFLIASLALILYMGATLRFPNTVTLSIIAVYVLIMGQFFPAAAIIVSLVLGILMAVFYNKLLQRT